VRNPLATGMFSILLGSSHIWSVERVIFIVINVIGILIGTWREERKLKSEHVDFEEYARKVPNRFLPSLRVFSS